jgi:NAD(P)-dependent dehydrogenase (short-subunit alcohol dehydrogenase family)
MSLLALIKGSGQNGFGYGSTAEKVTDGIDLAGKIYLVTGCNSGLGRETVRVLAMRGARIIGVARTEEKADVALREVGAEGTGLACDLSEPSSVRSCLEEVIGLGHRLDGLIANAGIMALPRLKQKQGYEIQFFTNHIGHFILVTGLLDRLADNGRVVMVSSKAHERAPAEGIQFDNLSGEEGYTPWGAYGQSKLANLLFARTLSKRFDGSGRTANALHPGVIATNLSRHMNPLVRGVLSVAKPLVLKSIPQGAATQCFVATHPDAAGVSGEYWADCNVSQSSRHGADDAMAGRLWTVSEEIAEKVE